MVSKSLIFYNSKKDSTKSNKLLLKLSHHSLIKKTINKIISPWYLIPLLDRWLLGQIIPPMLFAISAFTVISLSVGVMFDLKVSKGIYLIVYCLYLHYKISMI